MSVGRQAREITQPIIKGEMTLPRILAALGWDDAFLSTKVSTDEVTFQEEPVIGEKKGRIHISIFLHLKYECLQENICELS